MPYSQLNRAKEANPNPKKLLETLKQLSGNRSQFSYLILNHFSNLKDFEEYIKYLQSQNCQINEQDKEILKSLIANFQEAIAKVDQQGVYEISYRIAERILDIYDFQKWAEFRTKQTEKHQELDFAHKFNVEIQADEIIKQLKSRFQANEFRHQGMSWERIERRIKSASESRINALLKMENSGGEPDIVGLNGRTGELIIFDCYLDCPQIRRGLNYQQASDFAAKNHTRLLKQEEYWHFINLHSGKFSEDFYDEIWLSTPSNSTEKPIALVGVCNQHFNTTIWRHQDFQDPDVNKFDFRNNQLAWTLLRPNQANLTTRPLLEKTMVNRQNIGFRGVLTI